MSTTGKRYIARTQDPTTRRILDHRTLRALRLAGRSSKLSAFALCLQLLKGPGSGLMALAIVLSPLHIVAQTGNVVGIVTTQNGEPLPWVHVQVKGSNAGAVTDHGGRFMLKEVPFGAQVLTTSMVGYATAVQEVVVAADLPDLRIMLQAQTIDLPAFAVQSSLTGGRENVDRIAGSAWFIGTREIQQNAYTDVSRMLRSVPGVNIQEEDGFGLRPNIGMRGAPPERSAKITIMEDGILTAPAPYADPAAYYFPTVGRMSGVEVVKGSSQIRSGPLTTGGSINFISTPIPDQRAGLVSLWGGSYGTRNVHAHAGINEGGFGALVETFQSASDGFKELDAPGTTGFNKSDMLAKLQWRSPAKARVQQAVAVKAVMTNELSNETYLGISLDDLGATPFRRYAGSAKDRMDVQHDLLTAKYAITLPRGPQFAITAYRTNTYRNWYKLDQVVDTTGAKVGIAALLEDPSSNPYAFGVLQGATSNANALQVKANNRNYQSSGLQLSADHTISREHATHRFEFGARLHNDFMDRYQWTDGYRMSNGQMLQTSAGVPGTESNRISSAQALAMHLAYDLQYGKFGLHPGIRREQIDMTLQNYGTQDPGRNGTALSTTTNTVEVWIPGIAADYLLTKDLLVFAGMHRGSSPPGPNPETRPEASVNSEIGMRWSKAGINVQAIGFHNDYQELLGSDMAAAGGTGSGDMFNGGAALVRGLELFAALDLLNARSQRWGLPVSVAYTFTDARFSSTFQSNFSGWGNVLQGNAIPFIAQHQVNARVGVEHARGGVSLGITHVGDMPTEAGSNALELSRRIPAFTVVDASAHYRWTDKAEVFATAQNLLDQVYLVSLVPAGARPGMPRTLQAGLRFRF